MSSCGLLSPYREGLFQKSYLCWASHHCLTCKGDNDGQRIWSFHTYPNYHSEKTALTPRGYDAITGDMRGWKGAHCHLSQWPYVALGWNSYWNGPHMSSTFLGNKEHSIRVSKRAILSPQKIRKIHLNIVRTCQCPMVSVETQRYNIYLF